MRKILRPKKTLTTLEVGVQCLALLCSSEEIEVKDDPLDEAASPTASLDDASSPTASIEDTKLDEEEF